MLPYTNSENLERVVRRTKTSLALSIIIIVLQIINLTLSYMSFQKMKELDTILQRHAAPSVNAISDLK